MGNKIVFKNIQFSIEIIVSLLAFLYFGNRAMYILWLSAFEQNVPYLEQLEFRFWLFASLSLFFFVVLTLRIVFKIKAINKRYREKQRKNSNEGSDSVLR